MNNTQITDQKISSILHNLKPYTDQMKECLLIGWSISKLCHTDKVFTSKQDFIKSIKSNPDNSLLMKHLKRQVELGLKNISEKNLFSVLNSLEKYSLIDICNTLNYLPQKHSYNKLNDLLIALANVKNTDTILDPTSGSNGAWLTFLEQNPTQTIVLQEADLDKAALAYLYTKILNATNCQVYQADVLKDPKYTKNRKLELFDKVITFPPISIKISKDAITQNKFNRFRYGDLPYTKGDAAYISNSISSLNEKGKAVIVVADGPLFQGAKVAAFRKYLVEHDLIESVIALPEKLLASSSIPINILILNKNKQNFKGKIQFINTIQKGWYEADRSGKNVLTNFGINQITNLYESKNEVPGQSATIANSDYKGTLGVKKYIIPNAITVNDVTYKVNPTALQQLNTIKLTDLVEIKRGYNSTRKNAVTKGKYQCIKVTDITPNHSIDTDHLSRISIKTNADTYLVHNNDILISTRGTIGKTALVTNIEDNTVPNANLAILRAISDKVNMTWLMKYLVSPLGQFELQQASTGTTIDTISTKDLGKIQVPLIPLDQQNQAIQKFEANEAKLNAEKAKLLKKFAKNNDELFSSMDINTILEKQEN